MDAIETVDVTDRATAGRWTLPDGWTVRASISPDYDITDIEKEYDCYSAEDIRAWRNDEWQFVLLHVFVEDGNGRQWGSDALGAVEYGGAFANPLADNPGEYTAIREHDMIGEALRDAVSALEEFGTPVISEPSGATVTGL